MGDRLAGYSESNSLLQVSYRASRSLQDALNHFGDADFGLLNREKI